MQRRLSRVVLHPVFEAFICLVIASNVVMLSLEHYPMSNFALYMSDLFNIVKYFSVF